MQFLIKILQTDSSIFNINQFTYWLHSKTDKWITKTVESTLLCIFTTNNYNRIDNVSTALKKHLFQDSQIDFKKYITLQTVKNNTEFGKCLIKYFVNDIDLPNDIDEQNDTELQNYINNNNNIFKLVTIYGYNKHKLLSIALSSNKLINHKFICLYCSKQFTTMQYKKNHETKYCLKRSEQHITIEINEFKSILPNKQHIINITHNTITQNNITNNNITKNNITNNNITNTINLITKKDKLDFYYHDTVDIDTFIDKYKNDPKYQLTYQEAQVLLEILELNGYIGYGNGLSSYLNDKCLLIFNDINNNSKSNKNAILPFVNNDSQFRTHYEKNKTSWTVVKNDEKIKKILTAASNQLFNHHNKNPILNSRETKSVINAILKKADISQLELNEYSKVPILNNN